MSSRDATPYGKGVDAVISRSDIELAVRAARQRHVRPQDIWAFVCDHELLPEDFAGQVHPANVAELQAVMGSLARIATDADHLLWIATNHGEHDGLLVQSEPLDELADEDEPPRLSPDLLRQSLDALPGQQIAVIAACHAGIFLPLASERRVVLASCGAGSAYRASRSTEPPCSPFLCDMLSHCAGVNFSQL